MKNWERKFIEIFFIVFLFIIIFVFSQFISKFIYLPDFLNLNYKLGLDIAGGSILTYESNLSQVEDKKETMEMLKDVIERRINFFGINEPKVTYSIIDQIGRVYVELPGIKDPKEAINYLGQTPYLEFYAPKEIGTSTEWEPTGLTGKYLKKSNVDYHPATLEPVVSLEFNEEGAKIFAQLTEKYLNQPLAIVLDGNIISSPVVKEVIKDGKAQISGNFSLKEAKLLSRRLNEGTLPVAVSLVGQKSITGSYGSEFILFVIKSGIITFLLISLFMVIYYRLTGFISVISLFVYLILNLFIYKVFGVVLTLAGIIGFLLSIGMAIDGNILILERIKEEIKKGKSGLSLIKDGFSRSWTSIRDSNITTLISVAILYFFTSSFVRGFALTLGIGVIINLFTAVFLTRILMTRFFVKNA